MAFNVIEIYNVIIVIILFIISRNSDVLTLLLILFTYGSLHFGFAIFALDSVGPSVYLLKLHQEGGGILAKLSAASLLGVCFFLLSRQAYNAFLLSYQSVYKMSFYILFVMVTILCGYILNYRHGDWLQLKNVAYFESMLAFSLVGLISGQNILNAKEIKIYWWASGGFLILVIANLIAIYEVFTHCSWAGTVNGSGLMVYRASSFLFNPNLLGFWTSLVYLGFAYGAHVCKQHRLIMLLGMILASIALYMSGSRSASLLLLIVLLIPIMLLRGLFRWLTFAVLPISMLAIYIFSRWIAFNFLSSHVGWYEIVLLGERFAATPLHLVNYVYTLAGFSVNIPPEVMMSIEGRFVGEGQDSGWMVLYHDVGWLGFTATIFSCGILVIHGLKVCIACHNPYHVYGLSLLFYFMLTGIVMRFQIFPVWLFGSLILIVCLPFWRNFTYSKLHARN